MVYFKPGEGMRMVYYSVSDTGKLGKRESECSFQESKLYIFSITCLDALPLMNNGILVPFLKNSFGTFFSCI